MCSNQLSYVAFEAGRIILILRVSVKSRFMFFFKDLASDWLN